MSDLTGALADYLAVRRSLGYKLKNAARLLAQFVLYLQEHGERTITTELALAWATLPAGADAWHSLRLSVVRGFASHLHYLDPSHEVPPAGLLRGHPRRATPYIYSDEEIAMLITVTDALGAPHRRATIKTLIGLLTVTGMRVGEAIRLDRCDLDLSTTLLIVRDTKFGKTRELPVQQSTMQALCDYLDREDRPHATRGTDALLLSQAGTRLRYSGVSRAFALIVRRAGLRAREHRFRRCTVCVTLSQFVPCSMPTGRVKMSSLGWRRFQRISVTLIQGQPTGTYRPPRSSWRSPGSAFNRT
jgi:integrase